MNPSCRAFALGEEFTNYVLVDNKRQSIIINIDEEHFKTLLKEYKKLNYDLVFSNCFEDQHTLTCVFIKRVPV